MFLILFILLFLLMLFLPLTIRIEYLRKGEDDYFALGLYIIFKALGLKIKIPYIQTRLLRPVTEFFAEIDSIFSLLWPWKDELKLEKEIEWKNIQIKKLKKIMGLLKQRELFFLILQSLKIKCKRCSWKTEYGWEDPALTGISGGFIWIVKGSIISFLDGLVIFLEEPEVDVCPDFYKKKFSTCFQSIFSIFLGNIILTGLRVVLYKVKGGFKQWGSIQLKS